MDRFVGKRLDGRYEIQEIIGVGGMAVVYKARDNQENRTVAIKILKEEFISNEEFLRRFKNESKAIAMLSHPNIVNVYDVSFGDLIQYIVMEYIEGITLKEYIEREGSLRWKDAVHFTLQILRGLQHAHDKGIVHRDVKPQNIMVLPDGTIKVTDFGIARFARSDQRTITDKAIGSVHYISPEQARGEKTDEKADIYSVGVMLYEMLTGKMPFQAESAVSVAIMQLQRDPQLPTEINGSIPRGLEQITMHAMQKTVERRYQSAAEMLCDLGQFRKDPALTFDYGYFVDNSPTRHVGAVVPPVVPTPVSTPAPAPATAPADNAEPAEEEQEEVAKAKNRTIPILAGIAVALVIGIAILAWFVIKNWNTGEEINCPDFVGQKYEAIIVNSDYINNFEFTKEEDYNDTQPKGYVYGQSETAGQKLKKNAKIVLYVSLGSKGVTFDEYVGQTEVRAIAMLKDEGYVVKVEYEEHKDIDKGKVTRVEPKIPGAVQKGAELTVYVSSGKPMVQVPDVVGFTQKTAETTIKEADLVPKVNLVKVDFKKRFYKIGEVVEQNPAKGKDKVAFGSTVEISVCDGYTYDVVISENKLPRDYKTETYYLSLWDDKGNQIDKGTKIDSTTVTEYTFNKEKLVTKETSITLYVKISSNGENEEDLFKLTVDISAGKVEFTEEYEYEMYDPSEDTDEPVDPGYNDDSGDDGSGEEIV